MSEHDDVVYLVRESFAGLRMDMPVEKVLARSRTRRRRRLSGLTAAVAAATGAAVAMTLAFGGSAPAHPGTPPSATPGPVKLAAFSVTSGPGHSTTLTVRKGTQYQLDPSALRDDLARRGIPALVTVGTFCRSKPDVSSGVDKVVHTSTPADQAAADKADVLVIIGSALPPGTRLSIGYFPGSVRTAVIKDGAPLSCSSTFRQPTARITPTGTPIRSQPQR